MENSSTSLPRKFWSKSGIIVGIILVVVNVLISTFVYKNPDIRHPHDFSDLESIAYPNVLLGTPAIFISGPINMIVSSFYKIQPYSSIPNDDNNLNIQKANSKIIENRYQANLFIQLFITLSIYWFFVGVFIAWMYNKFSKRNRIFLIVILTMIAFGVTYASLLTFFPKPRDLQAEENQMMQGKHQVPCPSSISPGAKCWEPN
ncbi:MAG: hypothetical protein NTZ87_04030 [Candidatus Nomurabacteria bacterium]|nr:hypothetical protein [Candidatus Nomurabacteria bacterium]